MPVGPPRLDDLDYAKIEAMLRTRIPVVAPEWTDHNDSDPGITLIQLFAHLAESESLTPEDISEIERLLREMKK